MVIVFVEEKGHVCACDVLAYCASKSRVSFHDALSAVVFMVMQGNHYGYLVCRILYMVLVFVSGGVRS
jgi:hypothetical protein